jgi:hypothetical protein
LFRQNNTNLFINTTLQPCGLDNRKPFFILSVRSSDHNSTTCRHPRNINQPRRVSVSILQVQPICWQRLRYHSKQYASLGSSQVYDKTVISTATPSVRPIIETSAIKEIKWLLRRASIFNPIYSEICRSIPSNWGQQWGNIPNRSRIDAALRTTIRSFLMMLSEWPAIPVSAYRAVFATRRIRSIWSCTKLQIRTVILKRSTNCSTFNQLKLNLITGSLYDTIVQNHATYTWTCGIFLKVVWVYMKNSSRWYLYPLNLSHPEMHIAAIAQVVYSNRRGKW